MSGLNGRRSVAPVLTLVVGLLIAAPAQGQGQQNQGPVINQSDDPLLRPFRWREIGPIGQGGRVDDIAVSASDPKMFFVGFATGGLWKTTNNGVTFHPVFENYGSGSVGRGVSR